MNVFWIERVEECWQFEIVSSDLQLSPKDAGVTLQNKKYTFLKTI